MVLSLLMFRHCECSLAIHLETAGETGKSFRRKKRVVRQTTHDIFLYIRHRSTKSRSHNTRFRFVESIDNCTFEAFVDMKHSLQYTFDTTKIGLELK